VGSLLISIVQAFAKAKVACQSLVTIGFGVLLALLFSEEFALLFYKTRFTIFHFE